MTLLTEHPGDGIDHVGFAAAVGADDASRSRAAEGNQGALAEGLEADDFDFSQLKQDVPFVSRFAPIKRTHRLKETRAKRDENLCLEGRGFGATSRPDSGRAEKRLAGSQSEAQPPGAWMAVRKNSSMRLGGCKEIATECARLLQVLVVPGKDAIDEIQKMLLFAEAVRLARVDDKLGLHAIVL